MNTIVYAASLATATAVTAPTIAAALPTTAPATSADAELVALVEQFIVADRKYREAAAVVDRMDDERRSRRCQSPLPEVLRWRQSDFDLGLPPLLKGLAYGPNWEHSLNIDALRKEKWISGVTTIFKPVENELVVHWTTPTEAARARADEIIRAYDEWHKGEAVPTPRGYKKAEKARDKADDAATKLEDKVLHTRAMTIDGMLAKIRCAQSQALFYDGKLPPVEELEELETIAGCAQQVAESLFRDLWQMALCEATDCSIRSAMAPKQVDLAPDAELVALGNQYEELLDKYYARRVAWSASDYTSSPISKKMAAKMETLDRAIRSHRATSIEGLRAKALPAFYDVAPLCHGETEFSFGDDFAFQDLFQAVVDVVGLSKKVAATGYEMPGMIWHKDGEDEEVA